MDTDAHGLETDLTEAVIGSAFEIANVLGAGFLEKVYERALIRELALRGVVVAISDGGTRGASHSPCSGSDQSARPVSLIGGY
jgi:PD-(D/E)XK nuclease superfamily